MRINALYRVRIEKEFFITSGTSFTTPLNLHFFVTHSEGYFSQQSSSLCTMPLKVVMVPTGFQIIFKDDGEMRVGPQGRVFRGACKGGDFLVCSQGPSHEWAYPILGLNGRNWSPTEHFFPHVFSPPLI